MKHLSAKRLTMVAKCTHFALIINTIIKTTSVRDGDPRNVGGGRG